MVVLEQGLWIGGKYRLESPIGDGGMGVVWAATHEQLSRSVALKFLLVEKFCQSGPQRSAAIDRFLREGRTAAQLQSEHVVSVLDVGTVGADGSLPYLVMERLVGTDLEAVLEQRGALSMNDAVDYLLQACEAMAEAHARHIVHRDLKPENLFLTRRIDGSPLIKVLDFGISKQTIAAGDALSLTGTGQIMGSPLYMSPEQFESSKNVDARTDVWSLGVIAFSLLTANHPWGEVESVPELIRRVTLQRALPLGHYRPDLPQALANVIAGCLEPDRERRTASVCELSARLSPFASDAGRWSATRVQNVSLAFDNSGNPAEVSAPDSLQAAASPARGSATVLESPTALRQVLATAPAPQRRRRALFTLGAGGSVLILGWSLARLPWSGGEELAATTPAVARAGLNPSDGAESAARAEVAGAAERWGLQAPDGGAPSALPTELVAGQPSVSPIPSAGRSSVRAAEKRSPGVPNAGRGSGARQSKRPAPPPPGRTAPRIPQQAFPERLPLRSTKSSP